MSRWNTITVKEAELMIAECNTLVLDMRDVRSFLFSHYPSALHLNNSVLRTLLKETQKDLPIIIYCYHGHSSQDIATLFSDFGFTNVYSLEGGYEAWFQTLQAPLKELSKPMMDWLSTRGFSVNNLDYRTANNETALMRAAREGTLWVCTQLLEAGASVNLINADGNNALWMACVGNHNDVARILLAAGVNINNQNDNGATVLIQVASTGNCELLDILLENGADPLLTTLDGFSPLDVAENFTTLKAIKNFLGKIEAGMPFPANA